MYGVGRMGWGYPRYRRGWGFGGGFGGGFGLPFLLGATTGLLVNPYYRQYPYNPYYPYYPY
ncbi:MAG: hypothetical protein PHU05_05940 [Bacilli bacterium]|nr:hypothetical protein [Bacilli bacterium]